MISNLLKAPTAEKVSAIPVWPAADSFLRVLAVTACVAITACGSTKTLESGAGATGSAAEGAAAEAVAYPEQVAGTVTELYGVVPRASRVRRNNNSLLLQVYGKPEIIC